MIGIFWVYKGTVFGRAVEVDQGQERAPGMFDSSDNHSDFWEQEREHLRLFPELRFSEYFDVPRGRVVYNREENLAVVYMDKALMNDRTKALLRAFFTLQDRKVSWRTDLHYTTAAEEIEKLLE